MEGNIYETDGFINDGQNSIHETAIIFPSVKMGKGNVIGAYAVIGSNGEMRGVLQKDFAGEVIIGDNNVISGHVTIQRPCEAGKQTVIGNNNIIMAHSHIGHDAVIGNNCEICTTSIIAGYCTVEDNVKIKLGVVTRNRITIGENSVVGMGSVVTKDVPANSVIFGNPAKQK